MMFYSERKKVNGGAAVAPVYHTGENQDVIERQFHLNCANILDPNNPRNDMDVCEWGTIEGGVIERRVYRKPEPEPEHEPEPEEEPEQEEN